MYAIIEQVVTINGYVVLRTGLIIFAPKWQNMR